jgi:hypothetical protein
MGEASGEALPAWAKLQAKPCPACPVEFENHSTRVKIKDKFKS